jgi:hypothetical protein
MKKMFKREADSFYEMDTDGIFDMRDFKIDTAGLAALRNFKMDTAGLAVLRNFKMDTAGLAALRNFRIDTAGFAALQHKLLAMQGNQGLLQKYMQGGKGYVFQQAPDKISRTEKKSFSDISRIAISNKYGNIVVRESSSKQVDLEIQYFDSDNQKAECMITNANRLLSISTVNNGRHTKINYIISIPRTTALDVGLTYGNLEITDNVSGAFTTDISYGNLSGQTFSGSTSIKVKYSNVKIGEVQDATFSGAYSDFRIEKARNVTVAGNYNDFRINEVQNLTLGSNSSYGDLRIGAVHSLTGNTLYADLTIDNLVSDIDLTSTYGDVTIKSASPKVKNIRIQGNYCDVDMQLPSGLPATLNTVVNYGDVKISKSIATTFTESRVTGYSVIKRGQIGTGSPTARIEVTNNYADITIR